MGTQQRIALVTGAAGGVGQSTVEKLAAEGCIVIGTDIRAIEETPPEGVVYRCLLYTSPSPRDRTRSRMPSSA